MKIALSMIIVVFLILISLTNCISFSNDKSKFEIIWESTDIYLNDSISNSAPHNLYIFCNLNLINYTDSLIYVSFEQLSGYPDKSIKIYRESESISFSNFSGNPRYTYVSPNSIKKVKIDAALGEYDTNYPREAYIEVIKKGKMIFNLSEHQIFDYQIGNLDTKYYLLNVEVKKSDDYKICYLKSFP